MSENEINKIPVLLNINNEAREEGQCMRRSERKKVPSLWYIEHLNEYKKASKKNSGYDQIEKSSEGSELSFPIQGQYLPFLQPSQFYDLHSNESKPGLVAFVIKPPNKRSKELNRSKNIGKTNLQKAKISKKKPSRKFHQTFSSSNRQRNNKIEKKFAGNLQISQKKTDNNILDMILSAAMKVKNPSKIETYHKTNMKLPESEDEKKMRGSHRHEIKDRTLDCGYIKKSTKKNGKLYMEHSTKGNIEIDYVEKKDQSYNLIYPKLFQSKLFEKCFNYDKESLNTLSLDQKKLETLAKEKLKELENSFQEVKKGSLLVI